ncbi:hypothetical protein RIF29_15545 [Crotalaria pallida]|uniref:Polygalacturonase n=1 Tax=Crotalaria pallida TaxID=3830 RepID=A0AAN9FJA1_CROPI
MARWIIVMCLLVCIAKTQEKVIKVFNVKDYGAIADGKTNNNGGATETNPEPAAWLAENRTRGYQHLCLIPGPYTKYINHLILNGGGILDGQGASVWGRKPVLQTIGFAFINNGYVHHLSSIDSQNTHFAIFASENMTLANLNLIAPEDSPNTDGIKIAMSKWINIERVHISTGDDCIAMISGAKKVNISNVFCGPGHGISVGSLGSDYDEDVQEIFVKNCTFNGTSDGLRIKTRATPSNHTINAYNFRYEDIIIIDVQHPINIDQEYCPSADCRNKVPSNVQIRDVHYKNIQGSCNGDVAVSFKCSEEKPCKNIKVEDINLWSTQGSKVELKSFCSHVQGASYGKQLPQSCI